MVVPAVTPIAVPGWTSRTAAAAIASFSGRSRKDLASNPGSSALRCAATVAPPWTFSTRPLLGQRVEVAPDRHVGHLQLLREVGDAHAAGGAQRLEDALLALPGEHDDQEFSRNPEPEVNRTFQFALDNCRPEGCDLRAAVNLAVCLERRETNDDGQPAHAPEGVRRGGGRRRPTCGAGGLRRRRRRRTAPPGAAAVAKEVGTVTFGSNASDPVPKEAYEKVFAGVQDQDRRRREGQHGRPQHLPGADQHLPAGPPGRRLHVVRRLPHAVLRPARPGHRHLRRLGQDRRQLLRRAQERVDRPGRQAVLRPVLLLPVGALLPQERLRGEGLRGPDDARRAQGARRRR